MHSPAHSAAPPPASLTGLILAGGLSRRMGLQGEKALLPLAGRSLLGHVLERFAPQVDHLLLSANGDPARFAPFGLPVVADLRDEPLGPLAGVEAAFARSGAAWILSVAVDLPFLPATLAVRMREPLHTQETAVPVVATSAGQCHYVVALWPRTLMDRLTAALENRQLSLYDWFQQHPHQRVSFPSSDDAPDPFFNINRPADLQDAEVWCARQATPPANPLPSH